MNEAILELDLKSSKHDTFDKICQNDKWVISAIDNDPAWVYKYW